MTEADVIQELPSKSVGRVIERGFFPISPAATTREVVFSDVLAEVLGARPRGQSPEDLLRRLEASPMLASSPDSITRLWSAFLESYTITGERGARGKRAKHYAVPFHPAIAMAIKPSESRSFGRWYRMLMTSGVPPAFNEDLHDTFVEVLSSLPPSNLFERVFVDAAQEIGWDEAEAMSRAPIRPLVEDLSWRFQEDLEAWIEQRATESPSQWLLGCTDLFSFYFMMSLVQTAIGLHDEISELDEAETYAHEVKPIYFGIWQETASQDRAFSREWQRNRQRGIEGAVFDSWGRLAALRIINEDPELEARAFPLSFSEALHSLTAGGRDRRMAALTAAILSVRGQANANDLIGKIRELDHYVRDYYQSKEPQLQTPYTLGVNVVKQLGSSGSRQFIRSQRGAGVTFRLDVGALRFLARIFANQSETRRFDEFVDYLRRRGIALDEASVETALHTLESVGMIERQSDSGEAVYVRSL